jgi:hypothetical protein
MDCRVTRRRRIAWAAAALNLAGVAAVALWWLWPSLGDPIDHLPGPAGLLKVTGIREWRWQGRLIYDLTIDTGAPGLSRLAVSLPDPLPTRPVPVVFVMAGLKTGLTAIGKFENPGNNVVAAFEYPIDREIDHGWGALLRLPVLRARALDVPGQAVGALNWLRGQDWADRARVTPVGFSLGAVYLPSVLRLDRRYGDLAGSGEVRAVVAYGGAGLATLVAQRGGSTSSSATLGWLVAKSLRPIEPAEHWAHLKGRFLLVGSTDLDAAVPPTAARLMEAMAPQPKTVLHLPGGHVGDDEMTTVRALVEVAKWLVANDAAEGL